MNDYLTKPVISPLTENDLNRIRERIGYLSDRIGELKSLGADLSIRGIPFMKKEITTLHKVLKLHNMVSNAEKVKL